MRKTTVAEKLCVAVHRKKYRAAQWAAPAHSGQAAGARVLYRQERKMAVAQTVIAFYTRLIDLLTTLRVSARLNLDSFELRLMQSRLGITVLVRDGMPLIGTTNVTDCLFLSSSDRFATCISMLQY